MAIPFAFGRWVLLERIAVGGMAEVFAAVERGDPAGRLRAVKRLLPTLAGDVEQVRMFLDEARLLAQLDHPAIVRVHDLGRVGGRYWIGMDYVAGRDLGALAAALRRRGERLSVALAAHVAARAADALDHAHRARGVDGAELRVVHGDVSPGNLILGLDGEVRLVDFGVARGPRGRVADAGALRGKLAYMSPELVRGLPVDRRSDVFALGVVLHELLSGERLFAHAADGAGARRGEDALATMERVRAAQVPRPSRANPAVPRALDDVVLRALAREPEERFAWASELRDALLPFAREAAPGGAQAALARAMAAAFPDALPAEEARRGRAREALRAFPG